MLNETSPLRNRFKEIQDKVDYSTSRYQNQNIQINALKQKFTDLEESLKIHKQDDLALKVCFVYQPKNIKHKIETLHQNVEHHKQQIQSANESVAQNQQQAINDLEYQMSLLKIDLKQEDGRFMNIINEEQRRLAELIRGNKNQHQQLIEDQHQRLQDLTDDFEQRLKQESKESQTNYQGMVQEVNQSLNRLNNKVKDSIQTRIIQQQKIKKAIDNISEEMAIELHKEKQEREENMDQILGILEKSISKIQAM